MTYGGIPRNKIIEFAGEENSGKTTTALDIVANAQKLFIDEFDRELYELAQIEKKTKEQLERWNYIQERGVKKVVYCDCENTLDVEWAKKLNVDTNEMILLKPMSQTAEQIFEMLLQMIETDEVGLVVIDSLGVMVSQQAFEKTMEEKTYGGISMALTLFSKKAELFCTKYNCTLIGINQMRDDMSGYGQRITTGGKAWKHNCSLRLMFNKGDLIDANNSPLKRSASNPAGNLVEIAIVKTKVCRPDRRNGWYTLNYINGIDVLSDTVELACYYDVVQKTGAWYSIINKDTGEILQDEEGDLKFQGKSSLLDYLKEHKEIYNMILSQLNKEIENE